MENLSTFINLGIILAAIITAFVRNETNQKNILKRLDRLNGRVDKIEQASHNHIIQFHSKK